MGRFRRRWTTKTNITGSRVVLAMMALARNSTGFSIFQPGADNYNSVSFGTNLNVHVTDGVNTLPVDQLQAVYVDFKRTRS